MRFRVLGPLEVNARASSGPGGRELTPRAAKIRLVLATLLVNINDVVSVDTFIDELWGDAPPRTAVTTLQVYISQLRKMLQDADPKHGRQMLLTRSPGYVLQLDPAELDLTTFEDLHLRGREAMDQQDYPAAVDLQRKALALWRGPLLCDTPHGALLGSVQVRLTETRAAALEQRIRAELQLGHHRQLIGELYSLTAEFPLREEFHAHLMVALYRTGRQADALCAYAKLRRTLVDELAIEPSKPLQQVHNRVLTGDPTLLRPGSGADHSTRQSVPAGPVLPERPVVHLPAPDAQFTGRSVEVQALAEAVCEAPVGRCTTVTGPAGVGKTALAAAVAHRLGDAFPDGRVLVPLRDHDGTPREPAEALRHLLQRSGVTGPLPTTLHELTSLLRQLTTGRRILLILDGAVNAAQVRPLLPLTPGSTALVTSRPLPVGLGGHHLALDVLPEPEARRLLTTAAGHNSQADNPAAAQVVAACGRLPAGLLAAAALLAARPRWELDSLAGRLHDESTRLAQLRSADEDCYAALHSAYQEAGPEVRRTFRLLGVLPAAPIRTATAASILGLTPEAAEPRLEALVQAQLLGVEPDGRYRFQELLRLLARERLAEEEPAQEARTATARLCEALTADTQAAQHCADVDGLHPLDWFARHQGALVAAVRQADAARLWLHVVRLADGITGFLETLAAWDVWESTHTLALGAAQHLGDRTAQARLLCSLGDLAWQRRHLGTAREFYQEAIRTAGDARGAMPDIDRAIAGLADIQLDIGDIDSTAALVTPLLHESATGTVRGRWEARRILALVALETEGAAAARQHFEQCLTLAATLRDRRLEAYARRWLHSIGNPLNQPQWYEIRPGVWRPRITAAVSAPTPAHSPG